MVGVHHDAGDTQLLVDAADHDLLVDRLVAASDEIAVEVDVKVVQGLAAWQRHIGVDVVHIEGVRGHRDPAVAQDVRAVAERVHEQVLRHAEMADLVPGDNLAAGHGVVVVDEGLRAILDVLVDIVGDHQVHAGVEFDEVAQLGEQGLEGLRVDPVVRVHDLEIHAVCLGECLEDGDAVAAVVLMDCLDDGGVLLLPLQRALQGIVLGGTVIHNDDLHVFGVIGALEDRADAVVHVLDRVVARDTEGNRFLHG